MPAQGRLGEEGVGDLLGGAGDDAVAAAAAEPGKDVAQGEAVPLGGQHDKPFSVL